MASKPILMNTYIPRKTKKDKCEWYEHDLMTYIDDLKCQQFFSDTDGYFQLHELSILKFINHECCGILLQNPEQYYKTIEKRL